MIMTRLRIQTLNRLEVLAGKLAIGYKFSSQKVNLFREEPEYSDQADTHDQYDSFKAQEDDSHYIDHDNDDSFNFDSEGLVYNQMCAYYMVI